MTAQARDQLIYKGESYGMINTPLASYLSRMLYLYRFVSFATTLWRGYTATWSIEGDRLYLKAVDGVLEGHFGQKRGCLEDLFPGYPDGIFVHWCTGTLQCPIGSRLGDPNAPNRGGNTHVYERDLLITLKNGVVLEARFRNNVEEQHRN